MNRNAAPSAPPTKIDDPAMDDGWLDYDEDDGRDPGEDCGRWSNGRLTESCGKAGSEECYFECPYRGSL